MKPIKHTLLGALAVFGLASSAAMAEGQEDYGQSVVQNEPRVAKPISGDLTLEQRRALYPPRGPRPGVYRLRALHSGNCAVNYMPNQQPPRLAQMQCPDSNYQYTEFYFLPHPAGGYTIRTQLAGGDARAPVPGQVSNCLTVARGVVFGPARMDLLACDVPNGQGWLQAGAEDQRFSVLKVTSDAWEIRIGGEGLGGDDCVAAQGGSRAERTDYIKWGCNGNADQRFMLEWIRPIPADVEAPTLALSKWFPFADGHYRLSPANGVDLSGQSYSSFETIDDKGEYCMRRCAELAECKAWTWTGPNYIGNDPPKCYWKRAAGTPINRGARSMGKLFSGIVRM